ncbi:hypothetical protein DCN14_20230 [Burkholderia sp. IDO3]|nr:hypothetical protein DCN14_20230 [Burkholderia sp. IDO3]
MPRAAGGAIIRQPTCAARKPRMSTATRKGEGDPLDAGGAADRSQARMRASIDRDTGSRQTRTGANAGRS